MSRFFVIIDFYYSMSNYFQFKKFKVNQDKSAMKIGTDGVLLGAWADISHNPYSILDVGTGTGVIALQMAQRSFAEVIDAIELEDMAYEQAVENFEASDWNDRLFCYHASFQEFFEEIEDTYDHIISNPPFYTDEYKSNNEARDLARFTDTLPFEILLYGTRVLLSEAGRASFIIPFKEEDTFLTLANQLELYPRRITHVRGNETAEVKRSLIELVKFDSDIMVNELIIEHDRHVYTKDYINLVKDFYLKM